MQDILLEIILLWQVSGKGKSQYPVIIPGISGSNDLAVAALDGNSLVPATV